MPFEFVSSAVAVARQQQIWGLVIALAGIVILGYALTKGKPMAVTIAGLALVATGGYYLYQSWQLSHNNGEWVIRADQNMISWQSPDDTIDPSFNVQLGHIDFIDRSAKQSRGEEGNVYHLILKDTTAIHLKDISGINLEKFVKSLESAGLEVKETGNYHLPQELRNK